RVAGAVRLPGVSGHLLREDRIVRQSRLGLGVRGEDRRRDAAGGLRLSPHGHAPQGFDINRTVDRFAHAAVLEGVLTLDVRIEQLVAALVEAEEDTAILGHLDNANTALL